MIEYLTGLYLADGWTSKDSHLDDCIYFEFKDSELVDNLYTLCGLSKGSRERVVSTGTRCNMYRLTLDKNVSRLIRSFQQGYKNFEAYFSTLDFQGKHQFIKGLFDGDGSVCKFQGSSRVRIILYSAEESVDNIIMSYFNTLNIKYSISLDTRGHRIKAFNVGNYSDVFRLFSYWYGEVFLHRKYEILRESLETVQFYRIDLLDSTWFSCNRRQIQDKFNLTPSDISYRCTHKLKNGINIRKVNFREVDLNRLL